MEVNRNKKTAILVTDIDNTLFDWVTYYVHALSALLRRVEAHIGVPYATLAAEARQVFETHRSIEYPFVAQELASVSTHFGANIDEMLSSVVKAARADFLEAAEPFLKPYDGVARALGQFKQLYPDVPVVALTDAPRYVAMWKLNKLNLLPFFDAVYGLPDPRVPTSLAYGRVKVEPEILLKHLQQKNFDFTGKIRILPDDYEKPGTKGLKTVLMDYEMDESPELRQRVLWVGDNLRKDVGLGQRLGVRTAWAAYGVVKNDEMLARLREFSPEINVAKNISLPANDPLAPKADFTLGAFEEILRYV